MLPLRRQGDDRQRAVVAPVGVAELASQPGADLLDEQGDGGGVRRGLADALVGAGEEKQLALAPSRLQEFIRSVRDTFERAALAGDTPVLLTSPGIRPYVRSIIERFRGQTPVMSQNEIHPRARLKTVGAI